MKVEDIVVVSGKRGREWEQEGEGLLKPRTARTVSILRSSTFGAGKLSTFSSLTFVRVCVCVCVTYAHSWLCACVRTIDLFNK